MCIPDHEKLNKPLGQFEIWYGKLFYYHSEKLGWRYIKDI